MRITHKINHGWSPNRNDPAWEERVEREAAATTAATQRAFARAEARLARAQARLDKAAAKVGLPPKYLARLEAEVEMRRQELLDLQRIMTAHGSPSTSRGRRSYRGIPDSSAL